jgi:hypothetical protein
MKSLWPEDIGTPSDIRAPITVLKEQASYLGAHTRNYIEGKVTTLMEDAYWKDSQDVRFRFVIFASGLSYQYSLFDVEYNLPSLYPVRIDILDSAVANEVRLSPESRHQGERTRLANSEEELVEILEQIFGASRTKSIIKSILAQLGIKVGSSATQPDAA